VALIASISMGSLSSLIGRSVHRGERQEPRATMLSVASGSKLTTSPPLPGELLAELLPLVGGINAVPDPAQPRLVGRLNIGGPRVEAFPEEARTALQVLASHLAVAIDNATLYRETRWYAGLLATLYEIGKETASILALDDLLHRGGRFVSRGR